MASSTSGSAGRKAAMWTAGYLQQLEPKILDQLAKGKEEALGYFGQGREDITGGYGEALTGLEKYYGKGADTYERALGATQPVMDEFMKGYGMLSNALGLGGQAGHDAALAAFQTGPGYDWATSQATEAANRRSKQLGLLTSGNAQQAQIELSNNLANQEWGNWLKNLQPYQQQAGQMAQTQAQVLSNLGNLYGDQGKAYGTLRSDEAAKLAGISGSEADLAYKTAAGGADLMSGIGGQIANVGMQGMNAGAQAAQNRQLLLAGGLQLAGTVAGAAFGGPMGAALGGSLGGMAGKATGGFDAATSMFGGPGSPMGGSGATNFFGGIFGK